MCYARLLLLTTLAVALPVQAADPTCANMALLFEKWAVGREQGLSLKQAVEVAAKTGQALDPSYGVAPAEFTGPMVIIVLNVYTNPAYKHFGPAFTKTIVEHGCAQQGFDAWW